MQKVIKYLTVGAALATILAPSLALAVVAPTVPPGIGGSTLTGSGLVAIINNIVNLVLGVSTVIAIGFFIYGAIKYATGSKEATGIMTNAAVGLAAMLAVGLIVNTIAGFINRGLNVG